MLQIGIKSYVGICRIGFFRGFKTGFQCILVTEIASKGYAVHSRLVFAFVLNGLPAVIMTAIVDKQDFPLVFR